MHLRHLTIGKKLALSFSLLGITLVFMGSFSLLLFSELNQNVYEITDENIPSLDMADSIRNQVTDFRREELGFFVAYDIPQLKAQYAEKMLQKPQSLQKVLNEYQKTLYNEEETDTFNNVVNHWEQYYALHQRVFNLIEQDKLTQAKQLFLTQSPTAFSYIVSDVEKLVDINHGFAQTSRTQVEQGYASAHFNIIATTLIGLLLVIFFATILARQIRNPLTLLVDQARAISQGKLGRGELCRRFERNLINDDETGQLAKAIREMKNSLNSLVNEISSSAVRLNTGVEEMSAISKQSEQGMTSQQSEIIQVVTAMNEMQLTLQEVSRNTTEAANAANLALESATQGTSIVQKTVGSIDAVAAKLDLASNVVQQLEQDSQNISMILDVIRGIADQTNLLALNAAIEAARAGEQGRGFAVVSDEVRTLAQRTQASTEEINKTIEQLQARTAEASIAMQASRSQMQDSLDLASKAGDSIFSINEAVNKISDMNNQIASATEEQNMVANELNQNLTNIQMVSEENTQGIRHTATTCQELNLLATNLLETTQRFDLEEM